VVATRDPQEQAILFPRIAVLSPRLSTVSPSPRSKWEEKEESFDMRIIRVGGGLTDVWLDTCQPRHRANQFLEKGVKNEQSCLSPLLAKRKSPQCRTGSPQTTFVVKPPLLVVARLATTKNRVSILFPRMPVLSPRLSFLDCLPFHAKNVGRRAGVVWHKLRTSGRWLNFLESFQIEISVCCQFFVFWCACVCVLGLYLFLTKPTCAPSNQVNVDKRGVRWYWGLVALVLSLSTSFSPPLYLLIYLIKFLVSALNRLLVTSSCNFW